VTSIRKILELIFKRFIDWLFRKKSLSACLYILLVFAVKELLAIFYGNDIYEALVELEKHISNEWIIILIGFIKLFFQTGFWLIFIIEICLIILVSFLIYAESNKPLTFKTIDYSIAKYSIEVKFFYILYNFFCYQRDLIGTGVYETTYEKYRVIELHKRIKSRCYMLFKENTDKLPISDSEFKEIMSITEHLYQENKIIIELLEEGNKIPKELWDITSKLGSKGFLMVKDFEKRINHNEYKSLINNDLKNQLLGFENQKKYEEYLWPTENSILNKKNTRELNLVKFVLQKNINIKNDSAKAGFEESELAQLYNKLNRSNLAYFKNGEIIISSKGKEILKEKLNKYKYIKIKGYIDDIVYNESS
jgi:hypothetical protein